jgi:hypothetical protein
VATHLHLPRADAAWWAVEPASTTARGQDTGGQDDQVEVAADRIVDLHHQRRAERLKRPDHLVRGRG